MTHVPSTSYESSVSTALVTMLTGSAAFRALVGAANAAAARAFVAEDWAGEEWLAVDDSVINPALPWATVRLLETRRPERAAGTYGYEGDAMIGIHRPPVAADTAADGMRRARNDGGVIGAEMTAQLGSAGCLLFANIAPGQIILAAATGAERGNHFIPITIAWRDIP